MALKYRSPIAEVLTSFTSVEQSTISAVAVNAFKKEENDNFHHFNYAMGPEQTQKLITSGIYLSPFSGMPHSHPVCKTLENYFLFKVVPSYVDNKYYFVGIKPQKLQFVKSRNPKLEMVDAINRFVTAKDRARYGSDFVRAEMDQNLYMPKQRSLRNSNALKGLVPTVLAKKARNLFLHDEIHYWDKGDLITFLEVVKPDILLATMVYPPEILAGSTVSLNRWCYEFEIIGEDLFFFPDGVRSEGYLQPLSAQYLLKAKCIKLGNGDIYMVDIVQSKFSHHLISITKGACLGDSQRSFGGFEAISTKGLKGLCHNVGTTFPISHSIVSKLYRYLKTLVKPDEQSAVAKLSQLVPDPTGFEIRFTQEFARLVIETKMSNFLINPMLIEKLKGKALSIIPGFIAKNYNCYKSISIDEFVSNLCPFTFTYETITIERDIELASKFYDFLSSAEEPLNPELLEKFYTGRGDGSIRENEKLYHMQVTAGCGEKTVIESDRRELSRIIIDYLLDSHYSGNGRVLLIKDVDDAVNFLNSQYAILNIFGHFKSREVVSGILRTVNMIVLSNVKYSFHDINPFKWFLTSFNLRGNVKYLGGGGLSVSSCEFFKVVVQDAILARPRLRKRSFIDDQTKPSYLKSRNRRAMQSPVGACASIKNGDGFAAVDVKNDGRVKVEIMHPVKSPVQKEIEKAEIACVTHDHHSGAGIRDLPNVGMPIPLIQESAKTLDCTCGLKMPIAKVNGASLLNLKFPDTLKNRQCGWYSKTGVPYAYNGGMHDSMGWPAFLDDFLSANGEDHCGYDSVLCQKYNLGGRIGMHSDDEKIFKKNSPILTVNLTGVGTFIVAGRTCVGGAVLNCREMFTMPQGFQQTHKHSISDTSEGRISLTFRCLEESQPIPDTRNDECDISISGDSSDTSDEHAGLGSSADVIETIDYLGIQYSHHPDDSIQHYKAIPVAGDGNCFWHSIGFHMGLSGDCIKDALRDCYLRGGIVSHEVGRQLTGSTEAEMDAIAFFVSTESYEVCIHTMWDASIHTLTPVGECKGSLHVKLESGHYEPLVIKNGCAILAVAKALNRKEIDILKVLTKKEHQGVFEDVIKGSGLRTGLIEDFFKVFDIAASINWGDNMVLLNGTGSIPASFNATEDHIEYTEEDWRRNCKENRVSTLEKFSSVALKILDEAGSGVDYEVKGERASLLSKSLLDGCTGAISSKLFNESVELLPISESHDFKRKVVVVLGTFGAGKSRLFKEFTKQSPGKHITFISPRKSLAKELEESLMGASKRRRGSCRSRSDARSANWRVRTFEIALRHAKNIKPGSVVIIDEIQLYPHGYLDLFLHLVDTKCRIYCVGDPCQSDYDSEKDRSLMATMQSDVIRLMESGKYKYNIKSRRFQNSMFNGRLPCLIEIQEQGDPDEYYFAEEWEGFRHIPAEFKKVFLVSSFEEKKIVDAYYPVGVEILTFGESTGRTFDKGTILVTQTSIACNEKRWITALSRFSSNLAFLNISGTNIDGVHSMFMNRALAKFLSKEASIEDTKVNLIGEFELITSFDKNKCRDFFVKEEKLKGDPWLKGLLFLGQREDIEEAEVQEVIMQEEIFSTHLPRCDLESIRAGWVHKIMAKEYREMWIKGLVTNQFSEDHSKNRGKILTNCAERFESIYPRHKNGDTATFLMAVKKRMSFSNPAKECSAFKKAEPFGEFLLKKFLSMVPLKPRHDKGMMESALIDFEDKKTSKSAATIENHSGRSCRDWLADVGFVFMKSQHCTKFEKRFCDAKAAQSIVCFQHEVLCRFAPYMRYIEKKLNEALPRNFYIHSGKGLEELNSWVIESNFEGVCTESDYEAFDASQDEFTLAFEVAIMKFLGLPADLVEDYKYIKTHLGSKLGNFAIMRFSGEASTFLFNTMANMLFTFLKYEINGSERICFAGDDMCASKRLRATNENEKFLSMIKLKAKVGYTEKPTFCGWNLTKYGIFKKPQLVLERMCIAKENNNLQNCIDNYALEVSFAYLLGEAAVNLMDPEEVEAHYQCVRIIVQSKHLMKSKAVEIFQNSKQGFSI